MFSKSRNVLFFWLILKMSIFVTSGFITHQACQGSNYRTNYTTVTLELLCTVSVSLLFYPLAVMA